jgi:hypothetical protein
MTNLHRAGTEIIETTVGELIEIITQIALESGTSREEGYQLASLTLGKMLGERGLDLELAL